MGDGSLYRTLLDELGVPEDEHMPLLEALSRRDLSGLETRVDALGLARAERDLLVRLPALRGGPEVLERADGRRRGASRACAPARAARRARAWPTA